MTSKERRNEARYDQESTVYLGPPSGVFTVDEVAQSPYLTSPAEEANYTQKLSVSSQAALAARCSTKDVQDEVTRSMRDKDVVQLLRKRLLAWADDGADAASQLSGRRSNKTRRVQKKRESAMELKEELILDGIDCIIPDAFKIYAHPRLASLYHQRESLLEQNCVGKPVMSSLVKHDAEVSNMIECNNTSTEDLRVRQQRHDTPMVLSISIYARPLRGMWAKEKVQGVLKSARAGEDSDEFNWDQGSQSNNDPKEKDPNPKSERGLYGPLQLVQCIEVLSEATLEQVREAFLCRTDRLPQTAKGSGTGPLTFACNPEAGKTHCCFLVEDILYTQATNNASHTAELSKHLSAKASKSPMAEVKIGSLPLRTGKLYWYLHQGSCEHVWCITSVRALRQEEEKRDLPKCTFFASGAAVQPLSRWTRARNLLTRPKLLDNCDLCDSRHATMLIIGGSRVHIRATNIDGLQEDVTRACDECWSALTWDKDATSTNSSSSGSSRISKQTPSALKWTVVPAMD